MSKMLMSDTLVLDGVRRTKDGYLAADARVARVGIQKYKGYELGRPELGNVMVYRPAEEVFHKDALRSMAHRPVTLTHPPEVVDAKNWKKYAKGHTGDEVLRDGDHVRIPMVLMDAEAIAAVEDGTRELSMGYSTELKWGAGVTEDGQKYDAKQTEIRANHLAVVPTARGGKTLKIGDDDMAYDKCPQCGADVDPDETECKNCGASTTLAKDEAAKKQIISPKQTKDAAKGGNMKGKAKMSTVVIDGVNVEVADDLSSAIINNKMKTLADEIETLKGDITKKQAAIDSASGEITVLKKQVADAVITPAKLDILVNERSSVITAAATLVDARTFEFGGKSLEDIRRASVAIKLGDAVVKEMSDASIEGAFKALTVDAPKGGTRALVDNIAKVGNGHGYQDNREAAYADYNKNLTDAWKTKAH